MQNDKQFIKNFITLSIIFGAIGTATFAGISYAIGVLGLIPLQLFLAIYFAVVINLSLVIGITYNIKQYTLERFVKTYPTKHGEGFELYDSLSKSQEHLNELIEEYVKNSESANYNSIENFNSYKKILRIQNKHNKLLETVNNFNTKEIALFQKFNKLTKMVLFSNFKDTHFEQHFNIITTAKQSIKKANQQTQAAPQKGMEQETKVEQSIEQEYENNNSQYNFLTLMENAKKSMLENEKKL